MKIYKLVHVQLMKNHRNEIKDIGYFSDLAKVYEVIDFYKTLSGFSDHIFGFLVSEKETHEHIDTVLYEAIFYIHNSNYSMEYNDLVGIYDSEEKAYLSLNNHLVLNGDFINSHNYDVELIVNRHIINKPSNWKEGFIED